MSDLNWKDNLFKKSAGIRQAGLASQLQQIRKQGTLVRRLVRKTQDGTLGTKTMEPEDEEDDTVHVGDVTIYNVPEPQTAPPAVAPPPPVATPPPPTTPVVPPPLPTTAPGSTLKKAALAALLGTALAGTGAAGALLAQRFIKPPATPSTPPSVVAPTDVDTQWELRLVE